MNDTTKFFLRTVALLAAVFVVTSPAAAQRSSQYPMGINPRGDIIMRGGAHIYELHQQQQAIRRWQEQQRQLWILDQQRKQQWLQQQHALRQMQQQQQFVQPHPNSTPMFYPPVRQPYQQQRAQQWQQQYYGRQQTLHRWNMPPLPRW